MNPTLRGFLIIALIALVVVVLQLQATLAALLIIARIAFILAIAFFIYLMWRERREEISQWPARAQVVFYGSAGLAVADLALNWYAAPTGCRSSRSSACLLSGFAMFRIWRDQHTYCLTACECPARSSRIGSARCSGSSSGSPRICCRR